MLNTLIPSPSPCRLRSSTAPGSLLAPVKGPDTGFIPFKQRHSTGPKRLAADALRTLESLYARSPYPSKDLMQSVCDMHRIPRWGLGFRGRSR